MRSKLRAGRLALLVAAVLFTALVVLAPDVVARLPSRRAAGFLAPTWYRPAPDGGSYALGTDYLGRPLVPVLCHALAGTLRIAGLGTVAVVLGCLVVGTVHGSARSRGLAALVSAGNLGVMAVPEAAVLIVLAAAWPRAAPPPLVNASMVAVLVVFAVPASSMMASMPVALMPFLQNRCVAALSSLLRADSSSRGA